MKISKNKLRSLSRKSKRDFVGKLKVEIGCTDCGYNHHPEALQFDHLPEYKKAFDVSRLISWDKDISIIIDEIAKTEVVCANCHAVRTSRRRNDTNGSIAESEAVIC